MTQKMTSKDAKLRWYDGTATPYYLEFDLDSGDFNGPIGTPLTEEILVLDRGNMNANAIYMESSDAPMMAPVPVTFSVMVTDSTLFTYILDWLDAMNDALATTVNAHTLVSTEQDSQRDGATNNPVFADANKSTCNIEYLLTMTGTDLGWKYIDVRYDRDKQPFAESEDGIILTCNGMCYGTITRLTSFTAGTSIEA